jgi:PKHD-type hydroxylase
LIVAIPEVLSGESLGTARQLLEQASWIDGRKTAGHESARVKENEQIPEDSVVARDLGNLVLGALERSSLFVAAALPLRVFPPLFNRYQGGQHFGAHVDNAIRMVGHSGLRVRTDLSATLFLSDPQDYDGGELVIEDTYGAHQVKLPAGHMVLYPASSLHKVLPVTRGARLASFFWVQSMVRDDGERTLLFDLDHSIRGLRATMPDHAAVVQLTSCYHNLLRRWTDV